MEKFLGKIFGNAHLIFFGVFFVFLYILERLDITLLNSELSSGYTAILSVVLAIVIAILTFFAVLSLHRLENLKGDESSSNEIRKQLGTVGKWSLLFVFLTTLVLFIALTDKSDILKIALVVRLDRIIIAAIFAFLAYLLLSAGWSYLSNIKPKDN